MNTIHIRIHLSTLRKIKRVFYARKDETCASYFKRLAEHLNEKRIKIINQGYHHGKLQTEFGK